MQQTERQMGVGAPMYTALKSDRGVRRTAQTRSGSLSKQNGRDHGVATEEAFIRMLSLERKRAERSRKSFVLMLLHLEPLLVHGDERQELLKKILSALFSSVRETDVSGWYRENAIMG